MSYAEPIAAAADTQVEIQMCSCENDIDHVHEQISVLADRLRSLLRPPMPEDGPAVLAKMDERVPHADRLHSLDVKIVSAWVRIAELIRLLEI